MGLGGDSSTGSRGSSKNIPQSSFTPTAHRSALINKNVVSRRSKHIDVNDHVAREQAKLSTVRNVCFSFPLVSS